nr:HD domain-containing phosphohydrolase [uncultured Undibacterium sp.]
MYRVNLGALKSIHASHWSIRTWLMLLACLSLLPFALIGVWQLNANQNTIREASYNSLDLVAGYIEAHAKDQVSELQQLIKMTAEEMVADDGKIIDDFNPNQFMRLHPHLSNIVLHKYNGDVIYSYVKTQGGAEPAQALIQQGKLSEDLVLSPLYIDQASGRPKVVTIHLIRKNNQPSVFLSFTIDVLELNKIVLFNIPNGLDAFVIDRQGTNLFLQTDGARWVGREVSNYAEDIPLKEFNRIVHLKMRDGRSMVYVQRWVPALGWYVMVGEPESAIFGSMRRSLEIGLLYFMVCLSLALTIAWRFSEVIARPIRSVAKSAKAIGAGEKSSLHVSGPTEIHEVALQLNAMLLELDQKRVQHDALTVHYANILESARDGLILIDEDNNIIEMNQAALAMYGYAASMLQRLNMSDLICQAEQVLQSKVWLDAISSSSSLIEAKHQDSEGNTFSVEISSNSLMVDGKVYRQCFIRNISERKKLELSLHHRTRALEALRASTNVISNAKNLNTLLADLCTVLIERTGYRMAWIGASEFDEERKVRPLASAGDNKNYISNLNITWADNEAGRGPTGSAIRTGQTVIARNIQTDPRFNRWRQTALNNGFNASIALPLIVNDVNFGALSIYASDGASFDDDEVRLLEEMAAELTYGIDLLQARELGNTLMNEVTKNEHRFRMLIELSPIGIYLSHLGQISYANPRFEEILGYQKAELVGVFLNAIIAREDLNIAERAHETLVSDGRTGNYTLRGKRKDGSLIELGLQEVSVEFDGVPASLGMAQDISERVRSQSEIAHYISLLEHATEGTLEAVSLMVEQRDPYTAGHEKRVGIIAGDIGLAMGLSANVVQGLRLAGMVHDVGKISVPAEILSKPSRLSNIEMALVKEHAQTGYNILKNIEVPWPIAQVSYQHHERMDGSGYPRGLLGDQILLEARIIAVADVVESMTSHRPYRPGLGVDAALEEIRKNRGIFYDAVVVDACLKLFLEDAYQIPV